jgi:hypothetical protein
MWVVRPIGQHRPRTVSNQYLTHMSAALGQGSHSHWRAPHPRRLDKPSADWHRREGPQSPTPFPGTYKRPLRPKLPFLSPFFPNVEVSHRRSHHRLAVVLPCHSSIPCAWILPVTLRSFCPRFHHHRSSPLPSIAYHAPAIHWSPVSSSLSASPHQQGVKMGA